MFWPAGGFRVCEVQKGKHTDKTTVRVIRRLCVGREEGEVAADPHRTHKRIRKRTHTRTRKRTNKRIHKGLTKGLTE